jgi:uncharacterized 2Fe-2S/4Fe-4S cluster protein (DUF4445 family)
MEERSPVRTFQLTVQFNDETSTVPASPEESLLEALRAAGFSEPAAPCGGNGICHQCRIRATGSLRPVSPLQKPMDARDDEVLACRWRPAGNCLITLPRRGAAQILTTGAEGLESGGAGLGIAVDIGTTTVAVFLYDLETGKRLQVAGERNAQRSFGADVISRIRYCSQPGGLAVLSERIREQIGSLISQVCRQAGRRPTEILRVSIAGNTVMEHIFSGLSPVGIGVAPFTTESLFGEARAAEALLPGLNERATVYLCPALSGYVGGDITAGLFASLPMMAGERCLYMDIGTNGEMGLGGEAGFLCCATAAGPAFEGAEIACGMDASPGAIDKVALRDGKIAIHTLEDAVPVGICGSGLIDSVAALLRAGVITGAGRMLPPEEAPVSLRESLKKGEDGIMRFYLADEVYLSAKDVRELQLAKSAIRAGAETLLALRGLAPADLEGLLIAGGFGAYMDVDSALTIGLLPPVKRERIRHVGNAAGAGAALALSDARRGALQAFSARCTYHELSASAVFTEKYLESMYFEDPEESS